MCDHSDGLQQKMQMTERYIDRLMRHMFSAQCSRALRWYRMREETRDNTVHFRGKAETCDAISRQANRSR
jgi:hypothetical protein